MKKMLLCAAALALCLTFALTSCGKCEHVDTDWDYVCDTCQESLPEINTGLSITLVDQDGAPVEGVTFTLSRQDILVTTLTTDATGKATVDSVVAGKYTLAVTGRPTGYFPEAPQTFVVSPESNVHTLTMLENSIPNGTPTRPFVVTEEETTGTIAAGQTLHFHAFGVERVWAMTGMDWCTLNFGGHNYTSVDGKIEVLMTSDDARQGFTFSITNNSGEAKEYTFTMTSPLGSMENPYDATLGVATEVEVAGGRAVYYMVTADKDGYLVFTTTNADNNAQLYNFTSYQVTEYTDGALTLALQVTAGDEVRLELSYLGSGTITIDFTLEVVETLGE